MNKLKKVDEIYSEIRCKFKSAISQDQSLIIWRQATSKCLDDIVDRLNQEDEWAKEMQEMMKGNLSDEEVS